MKTFFFLALTQVPKSDEKASIEIRLFKCENFRSSIFYVSLPTPKCRLKGLIQSRKNVYLKPLTFK